MHVQAILGNGENPMGFHVIKSLQTVSKEKKISQNKAVMPVTYLYLNIQSILKEITSLFKDVYNPWSLSVLKAIFWSSCWILTYHSTKCNQSVWN